MVGLEKTKKLKLGCEILVQGDIQGDILIIDGDLLNALENGMYVSTENSLRATSRLNGPRPHTNLIWMLY
jgi:hypothetical protein